jgi:hypothetical protein
MGTRVSKNPAISTAPTRRPTGVAQTWTNAMKPIVTLTLNPTIDGASDADVVQPIRKVRTTNERYLPGGGGINVARVIGELGGLAVADYMAEGATGAIFDALVRIDRQRYQDHWIRCVELGAVCARNHFVVQPAIAAQDIGGSTAQSLQVRLADNV